MKLEDFFDCLNRVKKSQVQELVKLVNDYEEIIILGNGGSSAIASHIAQDYTKKLKKKSYTFSDSSRLTCYINDYGMENAYSQFLSEFANSSTLIVLISSSGNSQNMINCAEFCDLNNLKYVILTGFSSKNKLRSNHALTAALEIWIDSTDYGVVECAHQALLHVPV